MKLSVFCGVSVDGFLARPDHSLDFLETGEQEPHGFEEFYDSVDVVVIGRKTFEVVLTFGKWFYGNKQVVVLSSRPLDFSSVKGGVIEQMRFQTCLYRRWQYYPALSNGRPDRSNGDYPRASTDRDRHLVVLSRPRRHSSSTHCHAVLSGWPGAKRIRAWTG
jgi:hypothetical protein